MEHPSSANALKNNIIYFVRWTIISLIMGGICGLIGVAFGGGVEHAGEFFFSHDFMLYLIPAAGLAVVFVQQVFGELESGGTNLILEAISSDKKIHPKMLPCIVLSTLLSQLFGASVGKEGAALQIGGCLGTILGDFFHLDERDKKVLIMTGMSGCFAAVFGTPLAASMFGMEVISIGVAYYAALVPCVFAAFIGAKVSRLLGLAGEHYTILQIPDFNLRTGVIIVILGAMAAVASIFFCVMLHEAQHRLKAWIKNPYLRILFGSCVFIPLVLIFGRDYCSSGFNLIEAAMEGNGRYEAFFLKILFTAVALGAGFKGGEIVPTLAVGASFGCAFGNLIGFAPSLSAACGLLALFVGVTNCPIATLFLGFELFGVEAMPFFALVVAVSFTLSGYYGLYSSQKFTYSKTKTEFINRKAH